MEIEVCVERLATAIAADQLGADRIELCSALEVGGLTPSYGIIQSCVENCRLEVYVMIRPHGGNFVYDEIALNVMLKDIEAVKAAGAHGVVFGCLTNENEIDYTANRILMDRAKSLDLGTTFHRAFDFCTDVKKSLDRLIEMGFDRLLTSGQKEKAIEGVDLIEQMVKQAKGQIQIMAGSGINTNNASIIASRGIPALHFTARKQLDEVIDLNMGSNYIEDKNKITQIVHLVK
jgi:copper homeostasis protein